MSSRTQAAVWVTVPTYQEVDNIDLVLRRIRDAAPAATILVVDDSSPDGTADKADAVAQELGSVHVLRRPRKMGLGSAYREGFAAGLARGADVFVEIDADLSHDPADIPRLLRAVAQGADLAIGSRYVAGGSVPHWNRTRSLLSQAGNRYAARALHLSVHDATSGYRAYDAGTLRRVAYASSRSTGYGFHVEMTHRVERAGGRIVEVPICFTDRVRGQSKMSLGIVIEAASTVTWWGVRERFPGRRQAAG
jgi:dolichol-phosphate mannosyltransferase